MQRAGRLKVKVEGGQIARVVAGALFFLLAIALWVALWVPPGTIH